MIEVYRSKTGANVILQGESNHYLKIGRLCYAFDGELSRVRDGERKTVAEWLGEYIDEKGAFHKNDTQFPANGHSERIEAVLFALYRNVSFDAIRDANAHVGFRGKIAIHGLADEEERTLYRVCRVFDLSINNIRGIGCGAGYTTNAMIYTDGRSIFIRCKDMVFQTDYDAGLYKLLQRVTAWNINQQGRLKTHLSGRVIVPFAEVVGGYYHGWIAANAPDIKAALTDLHKQIRTVDLQIDHMCDRPENQYIALLAALPAKANHQISNLRTRIKEPFRFLTVYDARSNQYRVEVGIDGSGWSKRFVFDDLSDENEAEKYVRCFREFYGFAQKSGHILPKPSEENLLYRWSDLSRMEAADNPLSVLLSAPIETFERYSDSSFEDMPITA